MIFSHFPAGRLLSHMRDILPRVEIKKGVRRPRTNLVIESQSETHAGVSIHRQFISATAFLYQTLSQHPLLPSCTIKHQNSDSVTRFLFKHSLSTIVPININLCNFSGASAACKSLSPPDFRRPATTNRSPIIHSGKVCQVQFTMLSLQLCQSPRFEPQLLS